MTGTYRALACARDMELACTALVVLATTYPLVHRRLDSPELVRRQRPGRGGGPFTVLNFPTVVDVDEASGLLTEEHGMSPVVTVLRRNGISVEGRTTMPGFLGVLPTRVAG